MQVNKVSAAPAFTARVDKSFIDFATKTWGHNAKTMSKINNQIQKLKNFGDKDSKIIFSDKKTKMTMMSSRTKLNSLFLENPKFAKPATNNKMLNNINTNLHELYSSIMESRLLKFFLKLDNKQICNAEKIMKG